MGSLEIVGRSSSHFTRVTRVCALELGVTHAFRPVFDLTTLDPTAYAGHPALKIPTLLTPDGPWFGSENICRELCRRAARGSSVVMPGDVTARLVANAEELTVQAMTTEVSLVMAKMSSPDRAPPPKLQASLESSLRWLDEHVDAAVELLPRERALSFFEVTLFCLVTHLPFREVLDVRPYTRLAHHCDRFAERDGARQTLYRFDAPDAPTAATARESKP